MRRGCDIGDFDVEVKETLDRIQVLVATMNQSDFTKVDEMGICTDVVLANQADTTRLEEKDYEGFRATMITTTTRGVGINRNLALFYATGDILLLADDDMVYADGYPEMVRKAFADRPDADAILFNLDTIGGRVERRKNHASKRVRWFNALNYGAPRIAVKRSSLMREGISFSTCFGGGTAYSAGEDSLFLCDMLKKGLKIYTSPETIGVVDQSSSTWFRGWNKKYLYDKGAFFAAAFRFWAPLFCLQDLIRHKNIYMEAKLGFWQGFQIMCCGAAGYRKLRAWSE